MHFSARPILAIGLAATAATAAAHLPRGADIVGGGDADITDFPWQVSISREGIYLCGGSIISPNKILTSAHCLSHDRLPPPPKDITIRAGSAYTESGGHVHGADYWAFHPLWNNRTLEWDLAVITLLDELTWDAQTAAVQMVDESEGVPWPKTPAVVAGWGLVDDKGLDSVDQLQSVDLPVMNFFECGRALFGKVPLQGDTFCAGSLAGNKGTCYGDNGSALVDKKTHKMIGVSSSLSGCAGQGYPSLFTRVSVARPWIKEAAGV